MPELVVHKVGEDPQAYPDLGRGQAETGRLQHRVGEVLDQLAQLGIEVADRLSRGAQYRVAEDADRLDADGAPSFRLDAHRGRSPGALTHQVYELPEPEPADTERALNAAFRAARDTPGSGW